MSHIPFTRKRLLDWAGEQAVREAEELVRKGNVLEAAYHEPRIEGSILIHNRSMRTGFRILPDGSIENECPCYTNRERGLVCAHAMALGLVLVKRAADPEREAKAREEMRRNERLAGFREDAYIRRIPEGTPGAIPAQVQIALGSGWREGYRRNEVPLACSLTVRGRPVPLGEVPRDAALSFGRQDENLLFVLEDISEGPAQSELKVSRSDFANLLRMLEGRSIADPDGTPLPVSPTRLTSFLRMDLDQHTGELRLHVHTEVPFAKAGEDPQHIVHGKSGWVCGGGYIWPLETVLPGPCQTLYDQPVVVPRSNVLRFVTSELPVLSASVRLESDISPDLFTVEPALPRMRLLIRGSPASLSAVLYARYGEIELVANKPDAQGQFAIPDPTDLLRYTVRNLRSEREALAILGETGLRGECGDDLNSIVDNRQVLNFLGGSLPRLRRMGWQIDIEGKAAPYLDSLGFATPVVHVENASDERWFDIAFGFEDAQGLSLSHADVQHALLRGESFVRRGDRTVLIDADAVESMRQVFHDCVSAESDQPGHFRLSSIYGPFVKSSLDALDGVDVEDTPQWRSRAEACNRITRPPSADLPEATHDILRPYQREGVDWLRFLEANGFCGILADEMGLGKTVQTLIWLAIARCDAESEGMPALIVCPTSIVENWVEEAGRFVPHLTVLAVNGPNREALWQKAADADIVVTSYALLRRDLERCLEIEYSVMVLDEAQHIKNRSTQNALAAKKIRAHHRLVLTGTPVENGVSDLWSLMDFLMPGYLGSHEHFRENYERAIARGGPDAELAQLKLRRKLHPFLLRRLKSDVARDLPPKIERVSTCALTADQALVYGELLAASRRRISQMVAERGFQKCRMEILAVLMRLRQTCCHLGLLNLPGVKPEYPSGKMDMFFELLDEALDGGHRVLVFSQFVAMLSILRQELESRQITYCYLDGSTKDRMDVVRRFNTQRDIPLFLISLKAGGSGLNLTGADMVIHYDPWWNPAVEDQATDRAHRIGQQRTVYSVKLITRGTVEEKVVALQERKQAVIAATVESAEGETAMPDYSWEDIRDILSL